MASRQRFRTQFCFIAPAGVLDRYASHSHTHLVLPQVDNPQYVEFYQRKRREGDLIILDNGAYELNSSVDADVMIRALEKYNPQVAALPDFLLQDGEKTFEESKKFLYFISGRFPHVKWMYIPQAVEGDVKGWYKWLWIGVKELKPDWIGIPRALATHISTGPNGWAERINAVEQLTMRGLKTHCLGMTAGNLLELEGLFWEGCCSIDSGAPVWRGLMNSKLDDVQDRVDWGVNGPPVDFYFKGVDDNKAQPFNDSIIKHNMNLVLSALGQPRII